MAITVSLAKSRGTNSYSNTITRTLIEFGDTFTADSVGVHHVVELAIALIEHFPKGIVPLGRIGT